MEIIEQAIESLTPYARNARTHSPAQIAQVAASIQEFGWTNPVLIDGDKGIIAGHGRVMAAESMGLKMVPTIQLGHLDEAQKRAYILADNQLALNAGWDQDMLAAELNQIDEMGFDLKTIGFEGEELDELLGDKTPGGTTDEDALPEEPVKAISIPGDVWICGNHVVICGDSTDPQTYKALMQDDTAQVGEIVLDPFGGSGSTMIACEKTRRHARIIELDAKFVDVIVHRWQDYTGQQAHNDNGESFQEVSDART